MGQGAGWTQDVLMTIDQMDPRVFPHLLLRLIELLCWPLLFSSAIPASPPSSEGWEDAFQHFSSGFSLTTSQLCQCIPTQNPSPPGESLWLHHWASSLSCSSLPSLGNQSILVCCLSDLPTDQLCPRQFSADQFLPKSAFLPISTGSIPICSHLWFMSAMWRDSGVVHLRQGYCWAEVIKILTAGIAVHPTHLHQKQLIWIIYILQEEYLSFQALEELQGGLGRKLNELICIN